MERAVERTEVDEVASADVVDGAVGVEETHWYVAVVNNNSERSVAERLMDARMGDAYECYVPTQREKRVWRNGRKKDVDRVLLPAVLFMKCTEKKRKEAVNFGYVKKFMSDHTKGRAGSYPVAIIPDKQMQRFKEMLSKATTPVTIENVRFRLGDAVRVTTGTLAGIEGNIIVDPQGTYIVIAIDSLGFAKVRINQSEVEKIN
ncbi:MAG: UpxY family transcription antiterminator [Bacteroidales bacterium]|nr:UpxY family transcription antiterminator [Bacteroidales bacterium]